MNFEINIRNIVKASLKSLYDFDAPENQIQIQSTRKEFEGDFTLVVFPFLRTSRKGPEQTAEQIGAYLVANADFITKFNVVKGFLNVSLSNTVWTEALKTALNTNEYGVHAVTADSETVLVEYSSPNTNKPLHLGHIRNNLLGWSVSKLLNAAGFNVKKVNIVNDRGIHICKSMLAHKKFNPEQTPENTGKKGDHFVGDFYVLFDKKYKEQIAELVAGGMAKDEAADKAPLLLETREMLRKWEAQDPEVRKHWETMNKWVYDGFDKTYERMGVAFDKIYYESETYLLGKDLVVKSLKDGLLKKKDDGSVWADLTGDGLDEKILLRSDGTSVYMTQDLGTAVARYNDYNFSKHIYVVGNEQDYHFKVLSIILQKMGFEWAKELFHMSYGMVELPEGKMKSREGTVVDADDLMDAMLQTSRETSEELGKLDDYTEQEKAKVYEMLSLGALKYFILKVDPKKNMTFNPAESIDFNGNTGPFIQYTHARIRSIMRKAGELPNFSDLDSYAGDINEQELTLIKMLAKLPALVTDAAKNMSPAMVANYCYDLAKDYNRFYHDCNILKEEDEIRKNFRLLLSEQVSRNIKLSMDLLGIEVPERM